MKRAALLLATAVALALLPALGCAQPSGWTAAEKQHTKAFLNLFKSSIPDLGRLWTADDMCSWPYISCTDGFAAFDVPMGECSLSGTLPNMLATIDGTQVRVGSIKLNGCTGITGTLPDSWGSLPQLTTIVFLGTKFEGTLPASWSRMTGLSYVSILCYTVTGTLPPSWGKLGNLEVLDLSGNEIYGTLPVEWNTMNSLQSLSILDNRLTGSLPSWTMTSIKEIQLSGNGMRGTLANSWSQMTALQSVKLDNKFSGCVPASWSIHSVLSTALPAGSPAAAANCATANAPTDDMINGIPYDVYTGGGNGCRSGRGHVLVESAAVLVAVLVVAAGIAI